MLLRLTAVLSCFSSIFTQTMCGDQPHIIVFYADDLGWSDVSYHGFPEIPTPNIDALAASGIILNRYYTAPQCTPSRASLMTGRYSINTGLQHKVIFAGEPTGLPLEFTILPQHFKRLGYKTHIVGKWHLGYYRKEFTPLHRGFDSFYGFYNGAMDYYTHTLCENTSTYPGLDVICGIDLHNGTRTVRDMLGRYSQDIFAERAVDIIEKHDASKPLFLYLSNQAPHTGNKHQPLQATPERVCRNSHIKDPKRKQFAGMVAALDDTLGKTFQALHDKQMLDNLIFLFLSDNGGEVQGLTHGEGSNYPLKGMKAEVWEGAVRVPGIVWSTKLNLNKPRVSKQLIHVADWLPTLYSAAGGDISDLGAIDGMDMWKTLLENSPSPRMEIPLQIDNTFDMYALLKGQWKLAHGTFPGVRDGWYGLRGEDNLFVPSMDAWVWKDGSVVKDILQASGRWLVTSPDEWRKDTEINCGGDRPSRDGGGCDPKGDPCLFSIISDPCEYQNLAVKNPEIVKEMLESLRKYNDTAMPILATERDPNADPRCYEYAYVPWKDKPITLFPCG